MNKEDRKPWLGFVGMVLMLLGLGIVFCGGGGWFGTLTLLAGIGVLIYAIAAGHVNLFGR